MASFFLAKLRRDETFNIDIPKQDMSALLKNNTRPAQTSFSGRKKPNANPFANRSNPFARRR